MSSMYSHSACMAVASCIFVLASPVAAQSKYDPGVSDREIKLGQTMPYSGPVTAAATLGKAEVAYFRMINEHGGISGRKVSLLSLDDNYNPAKTVEQTRRLVEQEQVLLIFGSLGSANNSVVRKYLNDRQVPQLLIAAIGLKWDDPKGFPWTISLTASPRTEMDAFLRYLLRKRPDAKIAALYQNDDFGKDYLRAAKEALGARSSAALVAEASYEVSDASIDSQIIALKASGADTFLAFTTPKFGAFSIRKTYDIGWKPTQFVAYPSSSVATTLAPAGLEKSIGLLAAQYTKDPTDPAWKDDPDMRDYLAWMKRYQPDAEVADSFNVLGYVSAELMAEILQRCRDDLTRANVLRQATSLHAVRVPMLLPGIDITISPSDYLPIKRTQLRRFDGQRWVKVDD